MGLFLHKKLKLFIIMVTLSSCSRSCEKSHEEMSAEEVLEQYLNIVFNINSFDEKRNLLRFSSGNLNEAIASTTKDTFVEAYINDNNNLESFSILEKTDLTPREVKIRFLIKYSNNDDLISVENEVLLLKQNKKWFLTDITANTTDIHFNSTIEK